MASETRSRRTKKKKSGTLIIVGGNEDKSNDKVILRRVAELTGKGRLVIATLASQLAEEMWEEYKKIFKEFGVRQVQHFYVENSEEAHDEKSLQIFEGATTVFFTGGDQLRITTKLGGTKVLQRVFEIYKNGGLVAGTSAGAAVMGETMLVGGENEESHKVGNWMMAPGLGFVHNMIIDQHFAQRGRIGRLLGAVSLNPGVLGVGIDEDTSVVVQNESMEVLGQNAVYVLDGRAVTYTNISEAAADKTMSMHDVRLHILSDGETFNLNTRRPSLPNEKSA